jgi:hypothetical protein
MPNIFSRSGNAFLIKTKKIRPFMQSNISNYEKKLKTKAQRASI